MSSQLARRHAQNVLRNVLSRKWGLQPFAWCTPYRVAVARVKLVPPPGLEPGTHGLRILTQGEDEDPEEPPKRRLGPGLSMSGPAVSRWLSTPLRGQNVPRNVLRGRAA